MHINLPSLIKELEVIVNKTSGFYLELFNFTEYVSRMTEYSMIVQDINEWSDDPGLNLMLLGIFLKKNSNYGFWLIQHPELFTLQKCHKKYENVLSIQDSIASVLLTFVKEENVPLWMSILYMMYPGDVQSLPPYRSMHGFLSAVYARRYNAEIHPLNIFSKEDMEEEANKWYLLFELSGHVFDMNDGDSMRKAYECMIRYHSLIESHTIEEINLVV